MDEHVRWLVDAITAGAARHDSFEVQRHFTVPPGDAVAIGALLHEVAGGAEALGALVEIGVVVSYRTVGDAIVHLTAPRATDGRLGRPAFHPERGATPNTGSV